MTGALLHQPTIPDVVKVILIIALQLATSSVGSMSIARSAYLVRTPLKRSFYNELADYSDSDGDEGKRS
nr:monovalent cation/H(+) antiporter subunit G [Saccharomonospora sp. CUA-673]